METSGRTRANGRARWTLIAGVAVAIGSIGAWAATGATVFSRVEDPEITRANESQGELGALFEGTGINDTLGEMERVDSRFTFGLLPTGPGLAALSVATSALPALAISAGLAGIRTAGRQRAGALPGEPDARGND